MKTSIDCVPCFVRQTLDAARLVTDNPAIHEKVLRQVLSHAAQLDFSLPPPHMGMLIHRIIRKESGNSDPYRELKKQSNRFAVSLYPELKHKIAASADPFECALRLAIAGNIIDFGAGSAVDNDMVHSSINSALAQDLSPDAVESLRSEICRAERVLYIGDNAGEIAFDRLLLEQLPREKVTFAVRGSATINDATREDADQAGISELVRVIDTGADIPGIVLSESSLEFNDAFLSADVIIAKGQGNYETLSNAPKPVFFLFKVKCPVVAADSGEKHGDIVIHAHYPCGSL